MNDNTPHYTELPIAQLEENKGQIDGLPATPRNIQPDKLRTYTILDNSSMGEWDWQALQLDTTRAFLHRTISLALTQRTLDRASLHGATRLALTQRTHDRASPTWGYSSRFDTTDARPCVPTGRRLAVLQRTRQSCVPTWGDSSRFDTTDARPCVPTTVTRLISVFPRKSRIAR